MTGPKVSFPPSHVCTCLVLQGISYLVSNGVLQDHPQDIACFIHHTDSLDWSSLGRFLQDRPDVLNCLVQLQEYEGVFLPDALRKFFSYIPAPNERGRFLENLLDRFASRYIQCNINNTTMSKGELSIASGRTGVQEEACSHFVL